MFGWWESLSADITNLAIPDTDSPLNAALHFFLYDTVKIFILLLVIVFSISFLRTWLNTDQVRNYLSGKSRLFGHVAAAVFGILTPFCSCSAIPLFLGFLQARIPLGVTFSYLISAPMNNEIAIALLFSLFGWEIALLYIALGLSIAILGGLVIGMMNLEDQIKMDITPKETTDTFHIISIPFRHRIRDAWSATEEIFRKTWIYILIGIGIGAFIHGYVPTEFITHYAGGDSWLSIPIATLMGIPMYSNAAGVMPLVETLTQKGMLMGTALSFMMAVTALSLPEAMILKSIIKNRLIAIFFGTVALGIMINGYIFNLLL